LVLCESGRIHVSLFLYKNGRIPVSLFLYESGRIPVRDLQGSGNTIFSPKIMFVMLRYFLT